ncbi:hypothetical protein [Spirochaeta cellobiosiphila]|uniref:hypothetical protein n=1 Tax=Spirochaeta cellobiosiphila TaxID=504483 RepID=UPI000417FA8C|nr:hypothetical protein [Spirochaeta cellobiosiphila]
MHEGCTGQFKEGSQVIDKIRMMGFSDQNLPIPLVLECSHCGQSFIMRTFESHCDCGQVYGVTPCHADSAENVVRAGINY